MRYVVLLLIPLMITGCADFAGLDGVTPGAGTTVPLARPGGEGVVPPEDAVTVEDFDTTTTAQRAAAISPETAGGEKTLGSTVASLGDAAKPGFWLETPLVAQPAKGRVEYSATGQSVNVDLIPIDGPTTGGSRISLAAIRLLGAPLTGLPELMVYGAP